MADSDYYPRPKEPTELQQKINWYLSLIVIALFLVVPPILCGLFYLSRVPDITWGENDNLTYNRVWMYRERRALGIGYEMRRVVERYNETEVCVQNRLSFFLWAESEEAQPAVSSQKLVFLNDRWQPSGEECR